MIYWYQSFVPIPQVVYSLLFILRKIKLWVLTTVCYIQCIHVPIEILPTSLCLCLNNICYEAKCSKSNTQYCEDDHILYASG